MIAVVIALQAEAGPFLSRLDDARHTRLGEFPLTAGKCGGADVLVCRSGIGVRGQTAARLLLQRHSPAVLVSAGFGGGLDPGLKTGDVVLCERVHIGGAPEEMDIAGDEGLLRLAGEAAAKAGLRAVRGGAVTVDHVAATPGEKALLYRSGCLVAEMEGHGVGLAAQAAGVPFLALRVVLDEADEGLGGGPRLVAEDGGTRVQRAVRYMAAHPWALPALMRLGRKRSLASDALSDLLEAFVTHPALAAASGGGAAVGETGACS